MILCDTLGRKKNKMRQTTVGSNKRYPDTDRSSLKPFRKMPPHRSINSKELL